jgi:hypothetical protein
MQASKFVKQSEVFGGWGLTQLVGEIMRGPPDSFLVLRGAAGNVI